MLASTVYAVLRHQLNQREGKIDILSRLSAMLVCEPISGILPYKHMAVEILVVFALPGTIQIRSTEF